MTHIQRRFQAGRVFRFNGNDFDLRHQLFDQHRHARGQATAAHRDEDAVEMGILLQQFQRQRALPGNHHRVVERRHPGEPLLLRQLNRFGFGFVKVGAVEQHFSAETAHRVDFDICGSNRHHDQRLQPQTSRRERHALGVVARRRGNHAARFLLVGQPSHHRVGAAQLKAVHRLAVFALHQNDVVEARREFFHFLQGRNLHGFIDRRA